MIYDNLNIPLDIHTKDLGPHWMATIGRSGLMAFADSSDAAIKRIEKVLPGGQPPCTSLNKSLSGALLVLQTTSRTDSSAS